MLVMEQEDTVGPINIGNPNEFTIRELADSILLKMDTSSKITEKELPADDPTQRKPDISLARNILNWEPKINLNEGLDKTIPYFKKIIGI